MVGMHWPGCSDSRYLVAFAGHEDVNDAERLRHDPVMRWIVGGKAAQGCAASPSQMGRFETQWPAAPENLSAIADLSGQWRDQMDAAVVPDVRGQRCAAPPSCARLQSRQFLADTGDARADQGLVTDKLEGEADQNRRESREPRPLCCLPNGRGRHPTAKCSRRFCGLSRNCGRSHHQR